MVSREINSCSKSKNEKDKDKQKGNFKSLTMREKVIYVKNIITIEPLICCVVIAKMVCIPAMTNLHFEKACKVNAGFNDTVCDAIVTGTYLEKHLKEENNVVQSYLTQLRSWEVPVSSVVPVLLVLFIGAYSDRHKVRKPFLLIPIVGDMVALFGTILSVIYMREWSLEIQAVADKVIPSIFGSDKLIIMISYAYIADISTSEMRTLRMAVIPILLSVIIPIVQGLSGILFRTVGYMPILILSLSLFLSALIYGIFMVKEPNQPNEEKKRAVRDVCNAQHVTDTFKLLTKNKGFQRSNFWCVLILCFIHTMVNSGEQSAFYLFAQQAYQWTVVDFSYFTTVGTIINFIGLSVAVPIFTKILSLNDLIIIIIAYTDTVLVSTIFVVVQSPTGLYIGRVCSILKPPGRAAMRSLLTKYVSKDDTAKSLSLNTIVGAVAATISAQVYHRGIYEHTRKTFPQAFLLFGIGMHTLGVTILLWMYFKGKNIKMQTPIEIQTRTLQIRKHISSQKRRTCDLKGWQAYRHPSIII